MSTHLLRQPHQPVTEWHAKALQRMLAGDVQGAIHGWSKILLKRPRDAKALYFIALCFYQVKDLVRAIEYMQACLKVEPTHADAWYNLGKFHQDRGDDETALMHYIAALEHRPRFVEALTNAGNLFLAMGDERSAEGCYHMALAENPTSPEAIYNRSFTKLLKGDLAGGWLDYEARWRCPAFVAEYGREFMRTIPLWDGSPLEGRPILLHAEQGLGDAIQFLRYAHWDGFHGLATLEVHAPLVELCRASFDMPVIARGDALPDVELQCPLMSLPARFGTTSIERIPGSVPYLGTARTVAIPPSDGLKVGLTWAGSATHPNDHDRSLHDLAALTPLFDVAGVEWYALQLGASASAIAHRLPRMWCLDEKLTDFAATAAAMQQLDLVITVDTAVAHLAGALGVKTWCMVPTMPEFRWMRGRDDSPWYPTMTLWRRRRSAAWIPMLREMAEHLRALVNGARI